MRVNKIQYVVIGFSVAILIFSFVCCIGFRSSPFCSDVSFGCDMKHRRAEVLCAFKGVNPFHVWNQDVRVDGFFPMNRPDRPHVAHKSGDLVVHDYPVWHTVWFFFYGLLPEAVCVGVLASLFGICATTFGMWLCFECIKSECLILPTLAFTVAMSIDAFIGCFFLLNYGVLILATLIVLLFCIKKTTK